MLAWHKTTQLLFLLVLVYSALPEVVAMGQERAQAFKIGAILPLSGPMAFAGAEVRDAITLALEDASPAIFHYEVIFEDSAPRPGQIVSAAHKLIDQERVDVIITLWPETANVVAPITEAKKILHYTIAWDPSIACSHRLILSHQVSVDDYARATLQLLKARNIGTIAFFHDSVFQLGADTLIKLAPEFDIRISDQIVFDRGRTDFRSDLIKARAGTAKGLVIWSIEPETDIFLRQVKELRVERFVTGFFDVVQDLSLIEGLSYESEVFAVDGFQKKFLARYGRPTTMKGPNAYDLMRLLIMAVEEHDGKKPAPMMIKQRLLEVRDYAGAVGSVSIDSCGNSSYPIVTKMVVGGKLQIVKEKTQNRER